jgi:hypothetical protein
MLGSYDKKQRRWMCLWRREDNAALLGRLGGSVPIEVGVSLWAKWRLAGGGARAGGQAGCATNQG